MPSQSFLRKGPLAVEVVAAALLVGTLAKNVHVLDMSDLPPVERPLSSQALAIDPTAAQRGAADSVVFIINDARANCRRIEEGAGWVSAPGYVTTAAHVVSGSNSLTVVGDGGTKLKAEVVVFDSQRDIAVLRVPRLTAAALPVANGETALGTIAAEIGFPDGVKTIDAAKVTRSGTWHVPNIYGTTVIPYSIEVFNGRSRGGDSGGPLVDPAGLVVGMVWGGVGNNTGYAAPPSQLAADNTAAKGHITPASVTDESHGCIR